MGSQEHHTSPQRGTDASLAPLRFPSTHPQLQALLETYIQRTLPLFSPSVPLDSISDADFTGLGRLGMRSYLSLIRGISKEISQPEAAWVYGFSGEDSIVPLAIPNTVYAIDPRGNPSHRANFIFQWHLTGLELNLESPRMMKVREQLTKACSNMRVSTGSALNFAEYEKIRSSHSGPVVFLSKGYAGRGLEGTVKASDEHMRRLFSEFLREGDWLLIMDDLDMAFHPIAEAEGFSLLAMASHTENAEPDWKIFISDDFGGRFLYLPQTVAVLQKGVGQSERLSLT